MPVVMSNGMGVDSAAYLTAILTGAKDPGFDLTDLTVVTAMTGNEYDATRAAMEDHLLPLLAGRGVRYVQLSRAGQAVEDGYVVLDDSRAPRRMFMTGPWTLADELQAVGTLPQVVRNKRLCSIRAKGEPIDWWAADEYAGQPRTHIVGFAAEEPRRAALERKAIAKAIAAEDPGVLGRRPAYPLIDWGWDRERCLEFLQRVHGIVWPRSCCTYCPFQAGVKQQAALAQRWRGDPDGAVQALRMEAVALALNPRMFLFGTRSARRFALDHGLADLVVRAERELADLPWSVYEVRRVFRRAGDKAGQPGPDPAVKGKVWRSVRTVTTGTAAQTRAAVATARQGRLDLNGGAHRLWLRHAAGPVYPCVEHFLVAAPAGIPDKELKGFQPLWLETVGRLPGRPRTKAEQLSLTV